jgi:hypothetical protein
MVQIEPVNLLSTIIYTEMNFYTAAVSVNGGWHPLE